MLSHLVSVTKMSNLIIFGQCNKMSNLIIFGQCNPRILINLKIGIEFWEFSLPIYELTKLSSSILWDNHKSNPSEINETWKNALSLVAGQVQELWLHLLSRRCCSSGGGHLHHLTLPSLAFSLSLKSGRSPQCGLFLLKNFPPSLWLEPPSRATAQLKCFRSTFWQISASRLAQRSNRG